MSHVNRNQQEAPVAYNHHTPDTADDASSVTLLGLAIVGAAVTIGAYWLLGS